MKPSWFVRSVDYKILQIQIQTTSQMFRSISYWPAEPTFAKSGRALFKTSLIRKSGLTWALAKASIIYQCLGMSWFVNPRWTLSIYFHIRFITFQSWFRPAGEGNRKLSAAWSCWHWPNWQTSVKVQRKSIDSKILDNLGFGSLESL